MPLSLSAHDQKRIARASRVIAAPFDFETPEAWMEATATSLREAVGGATSGISVPAVSGLRVMSPELPDEFTDWYLSFYPLLERVGAFRRSTQNGVVTRREAYGPHYDAMQETDYVQEFLPQIGSYDSITMGVRWKPRGTTPEDVVKSCSTPTTRDARSTPRRWRRRICTCRSPSTLTGSASHGC